jgi:hypothetical protein
MSLRARCHAFRRVGFAERSRRDRLLEPLDHVDEIQRDDGDNHAAPVALRRRDG